MDPKEKFKQAFAEEQERLSRQPLTAAAASADKRERWAQSVTPVSDFVDWLHTQKVEQERQAFGFGGDGVELADRWTVQLYLYHWTLDDKGNVLTRYVHGVLYLAVTPGNAVPFCWSLLDENGLFAIDTRFRPDLDGFLNEVANAAARLLAQFKQERVGLARKT